MKKYFVLIASSILTIATFAQNTSGTKSITTTLPILYINPNPQIGGLGEIGTVSSTIYNDAGLTQNPALLSRNKKTAGIKTNLSTWSNYNPDTYLGNFGLFYSIDSTNTIGYSFDYFKIGQVQFQNDNALRKPFENYHSFRFAHSFSKKLSAGIGIKFIKSDLAPKLKSSFNTFSFDAGIDYRKYYNLSNNKDLRWDIGLSVTDIGPRVNFDKMAPQIGDNIPINFAAGTMLTLLNKINDKSLFSIDLAYQLEKILVATPYIYSIPSNGWIDEIKKGNALDSILVKGYFGSFAFKSDSSNSTSLNLTHKFGTEFRININEIFILSIRAGRLQEHETKGGAKYFTLGAGIGLYGFRFDYSALLIQNKKIDGFCLTYTINLTNKKSRFIEN